jgi:hypothetical protein
MTPEEHALKFGQVSANLRTLAAALIGQHAEFPPQSFAKAFLLVGLAVLLTETGDEATATYLQSLAADIRAGKPAIN